jgi:hypothetical protein
MQEAGLRRQVGDECTRTRGKSFSNSQSQILLVQVEWQPVSEGSVARKAESPGVL